MMFSQFFFQTFCLLFQNFSSVLSLEQRRDPGQVFAGCKGSNPKFLGVTNYARNRLLPWVGTYRRQWKKFGNFTGGFSGFNETDYSSHSYLGVTPLSWKNKISFIIERLHNFVRILLFFLGFRISISLDLHTKTIAHVHQMS